MSPRLCFILNIYPVCLRNYKYAEFLRFRHQDNPILVLQVCQVLVTLQQVDIIIEIVCAVMKGAWVLNVER